MLFINTRPQDRAENLSHALRMAQIEVLDLPLLELVAQPWSDSLSELYQRLPSTQVIVVVSPTAVEIGMDYLTKALCFWLTKIIRRDYLRVFGKIDEIVEVFIILINHPIAVGIGLG